MNLLLLLLIIASLVTPVKTQEDWSVDIEDEELNRSLKEEEWNDDAFMSYTDQQGNWNGFAIHPQKCITYNMQDVVVFDIYGQGHEYCNKNKVGTYYATTANFLKAYIKQQQSDYYAKYGKNLQINRQSIYYLSCTQYYYNNVLYYVKISCTSGSGRGFQIVPYSDASCTTKVANQQALFMYMANMDMSLFKVNFDTCTNCVSSSNYNGYNTQSSVLCSASYAYRQTCDRSCMKLAKDIPNRSVTQGFNVVGKFFLFVFSFTGFILLLAVLAQRKRMSTEDAFLEEAAVKSVGLEMKYIPRIVLGLIFFIVLLILLRMKVVTWIFLLAVNALLLVYWIRLKYRTEGQVQIAGIHLYGGGAPMV